MRMLQDNVVLFDRQWRSYTVMTLDELITRAEATGSIICQHPTAVLDDYFTLEDKPWQEK